MVDAGHNRRLALFGLARTGYVVAISMVAALLLAAPLTGLGRCADAAQTAGQLSVPKPPEFTAEDARTLAAAHDKLMEIRGRLANEKLSTDEATRLTNEGVPLALLTRSLDAKKKAWEVYAKAQAIPIASDPQLTKLYEALFAYQKLYRRQFRMAQPDGTSAGPEPMGREWEAVADELEPFTRLPMTVGKKGTARYAMRALLVRGEALLYASVAYYRKKETDRQLDCYARGCAALEAVSRPTEEGTPGKAWIDREQMLEMPEHPYAGAEFAGAHDPSLYPAVRQVESSVRARQVLAEFCPWGVRTYAALTEAGIFKGLDWRILQPYVDADAEPGENTSWPDRSLLDYFAGYGRKYFWEHTLRNGPSSIEADFDAFRAGDFEHRGKKIRVKWRNAPKDVTYTVWVVSPMMSGTVLSDVVGYVTDAAQLFAEGFEAVVIDKLQDAAIAAIDTESDAAIFTSTSTIGESETGDTAGVTYTARRLGAPMAQLAKDNVEAVLGIVEKGEMEVLFESIDPRSEQVHDLVGNPKTYDGSVINPVIIRAYATGWEDTGENRFPRQWHYLRYYEFDPRALSGLDNYDLSQESASELPGLKGFLADEAAVQANAWRLLPDSPKRIGTRMYVTDHSPDMQELEINVAKDVLDEWMKKDTRDEGVVGVIRIPEPYAGEYLMGPLKADGKVTLGYALVNRRAGPDAPFVAKVAWHARQTLPTLFRQYQVRILVCKKGHDVVTGNPMYYYNDREAYELASFPVRFTPTKGNPATGKLRGDLGGESYKGVVVMAQTYGAPTSPRAAEAPASATPMLPRVISIDTSFMKDGVVSAGNSAEFAFKAYLTPCEPGDYHATVQIGAYTYHVWARVDGHGASAAFSATLPAPPGRNNVVVSCDGATASFILERNLGESQLDWANGELVKAQQALNTASDAQSQRWAISSFWDAHVDMAWALVLAGQYDQAKQYAAAVVQKGPPAQAFSDNASATSAWMGIREKAFERLMDAAYYSGDSVTMGFAATGYVKESTDRILYENANDMHSAAIIAEHPLYISTNYARAIRLAIAAGADASVLEQLEQEYLSWRVRAGFKLPQYDNNLIYHGPRGDRP